MKRVQKFLSFFIAVIMLFTCIQMQEFNLKAAGAATDDLTYTVENGEITIVKCSKSASGKLVIPETIDGYPVTAVDTSAFSGCNLLTEVDMPDTIVSIGRCVFNGCKNLKTVVLSEGIKELPYKYISYTSNGFFEDCYNLVSVKLPSGLKEIPDYCFDSCRSLKNITIPETVSRIGERAFASCSVLDNVVIPDSVISIGEEAFSVCTALKTLTLGNGVKTIGNKALFQTKINELCLPAGFESLGSGLFSESYGPDSIIVDENNQYYCNDSFGVFFNKDMTELIRAPEEIGQSYTIPDGVKKICEYAFEDRINLKSVEFPDGLETIEKYAFHLSSIKEADLPDSVKSISEHAFSRSMIKYVNISDRVESIGSQAFWLCSSLTEDIRIPAGLTQLGNEDKLGLLFSAVKAKIIVDEDNPSFSSDEYGAFYDKQKTILYHCPAYAESFSINCEIGSYAFGNCINLKDVEINYPITKIPSNAFYYCTHLENITLNDEIVSIGSSAFYFCDALESITVPHGVTSIGSKAFSNCKLLTSVYLPDSIQTFGSDILSISNSALTVYYRGSEENWDSIANSSQISRDKVRFNCGNETGACGENINWSFYETSGSLVISGDGAMESCDSFEDYGWYSFRDEIKYVEISDGITNVGANAFNGCSELKEVYLGENVVNAEENAFADCLSLVNVSINSENFTGENAFFNNASRLTFIVNDKNQEAKALAGSLKAKTIKTKLVNQTIFFDGNTVVYGDMDYNYISNQIKKHSSATRLYFTRLEFDGVGPDEIIIDNCTTVDSTAENFSLRNLYVYIYAVRDGEDISFEKMFDLLENGEYDAFRLKFISDETEEEVSLQEKLHDFIEELRTAALRAIKNAVNFIVSIFKKK